MPLTSNTAPYAGAEQPAGALAVPYSTPYYPYPIVTGVVPNNTTPVSPGVGAVPDTPATLGSAGTTTPGQGIDTTGAAATSGFGTGFSTPGNAGVGAFTPSGVTGGVATGGFVGGFVVGPTGGVPSAPAGANIIQRRIVTPLQTPPTQFPPGRRP